MEKNTIELFMWGYQQHIQISMQVSAEQLFNKIDRKLQPKVFLIGVLIENMENRHPICIEPEDCGYSVHSFQEVKEIAAQLEKIDEERNVLHTDKGMQESHDNKIRSKSYQESIKKILEQGDYFSDRKYYVAYPIFIEGYLVFAVLSLNNETLKNYYSLTKSKLDRFHIYRSFIDSVIGMYLLECTNALKDPDTPIQTIDRSASELIRLAGKQFMYTVSSSGQNFEGLHGFYDACNEIASMKYEGTVGLGNLIVAPQGHKNIKMKLQLKDPIRVRDYRKVRKFLELSDEKSSIISDSAMIYGIGELRGKYNPIEESLFVISFTNHFTWELTHDNNPLMIVEYREPSLPKDKINRDKFFSDLPRIFNSIKRKQIEDLWDLAMGATKQKHGTMLVISDNAQNESERLGNQCFPIEPQKLSEQLIHQVSSIDGAVLVDRDSSCYAIGVILDGLATRKGDSSRGARYNSAVRYYEQNKEKHPVAIIIVSEDGMINIIPDLMPQIKHSIIDEGFEELESILNDDKFRGKAYNQRMDFFKSINFYLTEDECEKVNEYRDKIEEKFKADLAMMKIVFPDLKPNEEMNESYYLPE